MTPHRNESWISSDTPLRFWETRAFVVLAVLISTLPLLWPDVPPLTDLPGHMGRYRIQIDIENSPALASFYAFEWGLIGNLGSTCSSFRWKSCSASSLR
jgi:hypothetical protein